MRCLSVVRSVVLWVIMLVLSPPFSLHFSPSCIAHSAAWLSLKRVSTGAGENCRMPLAPTMVWACSEWLPPLLLELAWMTLGMVSPLVNCRPMPCSSLDSFFEAMYDKQLWPQEQTHLQADARPGEHQWKTTKATSFQGLYPQHVLQQWQWLSMYGLRIQWAPTQTCFCMWVPHLRGGALPDPITSTEVLLNQWRCKNKN